LNPIKEIFDREVWLVLLLNDAEGEIDSIINVGLLRRSVARTVKCFVCPRTLDKELRFTHTSFVTLCSKHSWQLLTQSAANGDTSRVDFLLLIIGEIEGFQEGRMVFPGAVFGAVKQGAKVKHESTPLLW